MAPSKPVAPISTRQGQVRSQLAKAGKSLPASPDGLRPGLSACFRKDETTQTSHEQQAVFGRTVRTVNCSEEKSDIFERRKNVRGLRYKFDASVRFVAKGRPRNNADAKNPGLNPRAIVALVSFFARPNRAKDLPNPTPVIRIVNDADDRRMIATWRDSSLGTISHRFLRGLTEGSEN